MFYHKSALAETKQKNQRGKTAIVLSVILVFAFLSVAYLAQINAIVAKNFEIRSFQQILKEKENQSQKTEVSLGEARSLENLANAAKSLNLVSVDKINYLKTSFGSFALSQQP